MRFKHMMVSAALAALAAAALPGSLHAGQLVSGTVNASLGGGNLAAAKVDANAAGISARADAKLGTTSTVTATVGTTTTKVLDGSVKLGSATTSGGLSAKARANIAGNVEARLEALGPKSLLRLCISAGAKGCSHASRSEQIAKIEARLDVLSNQQLVNACVSVGGSCAASLASDGGNTGGGPGSGPGGGHGPGAGSGNGVRVASTTGGNDHDIRITCRSVLAAPGRYEAGLVKLCRRLAD